MNLAALIQSQTLATLLQAMQPAGDLVAGKTVEATLLSLDGDGVATAQVGDARIALVLAGPQARQADLQPGATLVIRLDAPEGPGAPLRATLIETRPAPAGTAPATTAAAATPAQADAAQALPRDPASNAPVLPESPRATSASGERAQATALRATPAIATPSVQGPVAANPPRDIAAQAPSPRVAAGPLLGPALARQDSLAPLFANLRSVAEGSVALVLPKPLLPLIDRLLAQAVPAENRPVTAQVLEQAVQRSGLFLEARQEAGRSEPPQGDLKASLTALRDVLAPLVERLTPQLAGKAGAGAELLKPGAATLPRAEDQPPPARTPPPRRDGALTAQPIVEPSLHAGETQLTVTQTLLEQTDAALDRITLSQYGSLPLDPARPDAAQGQRWLTEIPLAFQQGTAVLPLRIEQEPPRRGPAGIEAPVWRLRFALDVEPIGPLQGVVTLQGRNVGVTLWAEREETSRLLRGATPGLEAALLQAEFDNGTVDVHTGHPQVMQPTAGQFLDRMS